MENKSNFQKKINKNNPSNENIINNDEIEKSQEFPLKEQLLKEYGFYAKINGEVFDPREVLVLSGDKKIREIIQIIKFLFDSYPVEAIDYCLSRCFTRSFSKCSLLDKIMKYLIYNNEEIDENIIIKLILAFKEGSLNLDISTVNDFINNNKNKELQMTKLIFYDYSKEKVGDNKSKINEIFIEIKSKYLIEEDKKENNDCLSLEENYYQSNEFLGNKHQLYKRFCRREGNIYVYNFTKFEYKKIKQSNKKRKNIQKEENNKRFIPYALFECEVEGCNAIYTYNFSSNQFNVKEPHKASPHHIKNQMPSYYEQNIKLLKEKNYITDIQLVKVDE